MILNEMHAMTTGLASIEYGRDSLQVLFLQSPLDWTVLAQQVSNQDLWGQVQKGWNNFVQTGQIWAMIIGIVMGYVFRGFTRV